MLLHAYQYLFMYTEKCMQSANCLQTIALKWRKLKFLTLSYTW